MNNRTLRYLASLAILTSHHIHSHISQFRSPLFSSRLSFESCRFAPGDLSVVLPAACEPCPPSHHDEYIRDEHCFSFRPWASLYGRTACEAFKCCGKCCTQKKSCCPTTTTTTTDCPKECKPCDKTKRTSLGNLWFGKDKFRAEHAFFDSFLDPAEFGPFYNPLLGSAHMTPKLRYIERGAYLGTDSQMHFCEGRYRLGLRTSLPYKTVRVKVREFVEEGTREMGPTPHVVPGSCPPPGGAGTETAQNDCDFAFRLDFLRPIIRYSTGAGTATAVLRNGTDINPVETVVGDAAAANAPVYLTKRCSGVVPHTTQVPGANAGITRVGKTAGQVSGALAVSGSGTNDNTFHFGAGSVNYAGSLATDGDTQGTLFIVPQVAVGGGGADVTLALPATTAARDSMQNLIESVSDADQPSEFFLQDCDINLKNGDCITGFGDFLTELYGGVCSECYSLYGVFGVTFPTGKDQKQPNRIYALSTGNNGHFEVKLGLDGSFNFEIKDIGFTIDAGYTYNHVASARERKAAPFEGSMVRNIGPCVKADVSWHYHVAHINFTTHHRRCLGTYASAGYEYFGKSKDSVKLCDSTAKDCFDREKKLDKCLLEKCTDSRTHKWRGEIGHAWNLCRLVIGASHVFAGQSSMLETEVHVGMTTFF